MNPMNPPIVFKPALVPGWLYAYNVPKEVAHDYRMIPGFQWSNEFKAWKMGYDLAETLFDFHPPHGSSSLGFPANRGYWWPETQPHQRAGACSLLNRCRHILASEPGTGKTLTAIAALLAAAPGNILIICPAGVRRTWERELAKWWPDHPPVQVLRSGKNKLDPAFPITISSYELVSKYDQTPLHVVVDEAHYLKAEAAGRTKKIDAILRRQPVGGIRAFLSGTPADCEVVDLWSMVDLLYPGVWGKFHEFQQYYCNREPNERAYSGYSYRGVRDDRADELYRRFETFSSRITMAEVAPDLPKPDIKNVFIKRKDDDELANLVRSTLDSLRSPHQMILCHRVATAERLARELNADVVIAGGNKSEKKRYEILDALSAKPSARVVATMHSLKTGISLPRFQAVVYAEMYWNPSTVTQSSLRYVRLDSPRDNPTQIRFLIREGSIDEAISIVVRKRLQASGLVVPSSSSEAITMEALQLARRQIADYVQNMERDEYL